MISKISASNLRLMARGLYTRTSTLPDSLAPVTTRKNHMFHVVYVAISILLELMFVV